MICRQDVSHCHCLLNGEEKQSQTENKQLHDSGSGINVVFGVSGGRFVFPPLLSSCDDEFSE